MSLSFKNKLIGFLSYTKNEFEIIYIAYHVACDIRPTVTDMGGTCRGYLESRADST